MANATVSRLGLKNATGTNFDELFLKVFSGEVLTAFGQNNIFDENINKRKALWDRGLFLLP